VFCTFKTLSNEVQWLHFRNREFNVVLGNLVWVQWRKLWLVSNAVGEFSKAGHDSCSISFLVAVLVQAHAELNSKPIEGSQSLQLNLGSTKGGKADFLRECCEIFVSKHWGVTNKLVDDIWLRSVLWGIMVSNVLCRVENLESKSIQELSL